MQLLHNGKLSNHCGSVAIDSVLKSSFAYVTYNRTLKKTMFAIINLS